MNLFTRLRLLLWSNFLVQRRNWKRGLLEFLYPLIVVGCFVILRQSSSVVYHDEVLTQPIVDLPPLRSFVPSRGSLGYVPGSCSSADTMMQELLSAEGINAIHLVSFPSRHQLQHFSTSAPNALFAGVEFNPTNCPSAQTVVYSIRINETLLPPPDTNTTMLGHSDAEDYLTSGFLTLQQALANALVRARGFSSNMALGVQKFPTPAYQDDSYAGEILQTAIVLDVLAAFAFIVRLQVQVIVESKESKCDHSLQSVGVTRIDLWLHHAASFLLFQTPVVVIMAAMVKYGIQLYVVPFAVLLLFYLVFLCSLVSFSLLISLFFNKSRLGSIVAILAFVLSALPSLTLSVSIYNNNPVTTQLKWWFSLLPPTAFALGQRIILEDTTYDQYNGLASLTSQYTLWSSITLLGVDTFFFLLLSAYFSQVKPTANGDQQPIYFFLLPQYWFRSWQRPVPAVLLPTLEELVVSEDADDDLNKAVSVQFVDVSKTFNQSFIRAAHGVQALSGVTLSVYEGEIFGLLGPTGSGKSTLLRLITRQIEPTLGDIYIYGQRLLSAQGMAAYVGVCPQESALLEDLSVYEHLELFARLREAHPVDEAVLHQLRDLNLVPQSYTRVRDLSPTHRRLLCVAIALVGSPTILLLDEPTTGLDALSRRTVWSVMQNVKKTSTVIFTTHSMDEAELVCDRIAVVSDGRLRCVGSSSFLKQKFGLGHNLALQLVPGADPSTIALFVRRFVDNVELLKTSTEDEITREGFCYVNLLLPYAASQTFAALLSALEVRQEELGVVAFGVSASTLEEVFLRISSLSVGDSTMAVAKEIRRSQQSRRARSPHADSDPLSLGSSGLDGVAKSAGTTDSDSPQTQGGSSFGVPSLSVSSSETPPRTTAYSEVPRVSEIRRQFADQRFLEKLRTSERHSFKDRFMNSHSVMGRLFRPLLDVKRPLNDMARNRRLRDAVFNLSHEQNHENDVDDAPTANLLHHADTGTAVIGPCFSWKHFAKQVVVLFGLRRRATIRDRDALCMVFLAPLIFFAFAVLLFNVYSSHENVIADSIPLEVSSLYPSSMLPYLIPPSDLRASPEVVHNFITAVAYDSLVVPLSVQQTCNCTNETLAQYLRNPGIPLFGALRLNQVDDPLGQYNITLVYNSSDTNALPALLNLVNLAVLRQVTNDLVMELKVSSDPLPAFSSPADTSVEFRYSSLFCSISLAIAFSFIPAMQCSSHVKDRESLLRGSLVMNGVSLLSYWCSALLWDLILYIPPTAALLVFVGVTPALAGPPTLYIAILALCFAFALTATLFAYTVSLLACKAASARSAILATFVFSAIVLMIGTAALSTVPVYAVAGLVIKYTAYVFPAFSLARGLASLLESQSYCYLAYLQDPDVVITPYSPFDLLHVGAPLLYLFGVGMLSLLALVLLERRAAKAEAVLARARLDSIPVNEDRGVVAERERVETRGISDACCLMHARKEYDSQSSKAAVSGISFGVRDGECFGIIGPNDAGKSTIISLLSGQRTCTAGVAMLLGRSTSAYKSTAQFIGVCPQENTLPDFMTTKETLWFFSRLKGVPVGAIATIVRGMLEQMDLLDDSSVLCRHLSVCAKRKLCVAIAFLGSPRVVLLDCPFVGMDANSRQFLWNVVQTFRTKCAVVLSTHSMEECLVLCDRVGILVNGTMQCVGTIDQLHARYGRGYQVELAGMSARADDVAGWFRTTFPSAQLIETHYGRFKYYIPTTALTVAGVYQLLDDNSEKLSLRDYVVSQNTLEQVYLAFARQQEFTPTPRDSRESGRSTDQSTPQGY